MPNFPEAPSSHHALIKRFTSTLARGLNNHLDGSVGREHISKLCHLVRWVAIKTAAPVAKTCSSNNGNNAEDGRGTSKEESVDDDGASSSGEEQSQGAPGKGAPMNKQN